MTFFPANLWLSTEDTTSNTTKKQTLQNKMAKTYKKANLNQNQQFTEVTAHVCAYHCTPL